MYLECLAQLTDVLGLPGATHRCTWNAWRSAPIYPPAGKASVWKPACGEAARGEGVRLEAHLRRSRKRGKRPLGDPPAGKAARGIHHPRGSRPRGSSRGEVTRLLSKISIHFGWTDMCVHFTSQFRCQPAACQGIEKCETRFFANHTLWISNLKYLRCVPWMLGARLRKQMEHCVSISMSMAFNVPHAHPQQQSKNCDRGRHFFQKETETVVMVAPPKKPFLHLCFSLAAAPRLPQLPRRPHKAPMSSPGHINSHAACWAAWRCTSAAPFVGRPQCLAHSPFIESTTARENLTISARNCCCLLRVIENF